MSKVKGFLERMENEDKEQYFILYKFYLNPQVSLGGNEDKTMEKYHEFGDIKHFVLNNTFFEFLKLCMQEKEFEQKLDFNLLRKIRFILHDSKEFKEEYFSGLEDKYLRDWCSNKVPLTEEYSKKYNRLQLYGIHLKYQKHGWLYDMELGNEQIDSLNLNLINELIKQNSWQQDMYYERYIKPQEERELILLRIKTENYSKSDDCFLAARGGTDRKVFLNLTCNNEFLKIVEDDLLQKDLTDIIIEHIIEILEISINFKTMNAVYTDFYFHYNQLGEERIKSFDYKKAEELISLLKRKTNKKVIRFKNYN